MKEMEKVERKRARRAQREGEAQADIIIQLPPDPQD